MHEEQQGEEKVCGARVSFAVLVGSFVVLVVSGWLACETGAKGWTLLFLLSQVVVIAVVIWQACDPFADAAQWVGATFRLPGSVRGATLDAIASSMPELFSGIFFVVVAISAVDGGASIADAGGEGMGATVATCAGSAVYNMILIPAFCALFISIYRKDRPTIDVESEVIWRDGLWFVGCELLLIVFLFKQVIYWWMGVAFLVVYAGYVVMLRRHALRHQEAHEKGLIAESDEPPERAGVLFGTCHVPLNKATVPLVLILSTLVAAASCYWLVVVTRSTAEQLDIPIFFVAVILAAAASSVPDTFLSIGSAVRGDDDGAISNAFGSNVFDICVCFSVPLLVNSYLNGWQPIHMTQDGEPMTGLLGLYVLLIVLTVGTLAVMWHKHQITRVKALALCGLYLVFIAYAILGSLGITI